MRHFLVILLLSCSSILIGQNYAPIGATWHYETAQANMFWIGYGKWEVTSDTVLLGKTCSKVVNSVQNASYIVDNVMYVYEDSGIVYQYITPGNFFTTLYNFNANPGESWTLDLTSSCSIIVEVDSTKSTIINNNTLKVLHVRYDTLFPATIIERIGNINEPLPDEFYPCGLGIIDGTYYRGLRCYEDPIIGLVDSLADSLFINFNYLFFKQCDTVVTGIKEISPTFINIYPNPTFGQLTLSLEADSKASKVTIYNMQGQEVLSDNIKPINREIQLSLTHLPPALYLLHILSDSGNIISSKKILKY